MQTGTHKNLETAGMQTDRRALVHRRSALEARLLAHQCGWRQLDEVRLRRLRRSLTGVLEALGGEDPARALLAAGVRS